MQRTFFPRLIVLAMLLSFTKISFSQINEDSMMLAKSEEWKVQQKKGLFGLSKPVFGNFTTLNVSKIDSGYYKKKTKDSSSFDLEFGSGENGIDQSKYMTIQKTQWYKLLLASDPGTTSALFAIASVSKEKKQTFFSKVLSKNDDGKNEVLSYSRDVPGLISTDDSHIWQFLLANFSRGSGQDGNPFVPSASISSGYLKNEVDSMYIQIYSSFSADLVLINGKGNHVAALKFKQKPFYTWIRNDIDKNYQNAIAGMFAVIISIKDY